MWSWQQKAMLTSPSASIEEAEDFVSRFSVIVLFDVWMTEEQEIPHELCGNLPQANENTRATI